MKNQVLVVSMMACVGFTACAPIYSIDPTAGPGETIKYYQGKPTTFSERPNSAVQVTPLGVADGRVGFGVAVFNKSQASADFGIESVRLTVDGQALSVLSAEQLAHEAKVHAEWAAVATALAGAAAAYSASQNAYSTTNGYAFTPSGPVTFHATTYDPGAAYAGAAVAGAATGAGLVAIHNGLENKLAQINGQILQRNTVSPEETAGGDVISDDLQGRNYPKSVELRITFNGDEHVFDYFLGKQ